MAQLPPDGEWLIQQIGGEVILFHRYTEEEIVRFDPGDSNASAQAQRVIALDERLDTEQKSFAHFWSGYFYGCANL
jgi:hypothetical protein